MDLREAAARVRSAVCIATEQRAREGPVALTLSSGRDSGSVAVALGEIGIKADCLTFRFDDPDVPDESSAARSSPARWDIAGTMSLCLPAPRRPTWPKLPR